MKKSEIEQIEAWDKQYVWHPFTQMKEWTAQPQLVITGGEGVKLFDGDGKSYYDGVSSLWVNLHGHRHPTINRAISEQLDKIAHSSLLGLINEPSARLAAEIMEYLPEGLTKVFYSDDGSTAVEIAIKQAYQYWQLKGKAKKQTFVTLANAYHGDTVGTVSVGGIDLFHRIFKSLLFPSIQAPCPNCFHCQLAADPDDCRMACLQAVEKVLQERHEEIAALVVEPLIQAAAGMLTQPPGYLKGLRELTQKYDVLLLVDEVATGFGRSGKMFACEHEDVTPDFMMVAKGITGGYLPLAATFMTQEIYDAFIGDYGEQKTFFHGHSYTGNPLACAAALGNLQVFREEKVLEGLPEKIGQVKTALEKIAGFAHVGDVRQCGLMVGIELMADKAAKIPYPWEEAVGARVCSEARRLGLIIRPLGNVVVFMPPLASNNQELAEMTEIIMKAIKSVTEEGVGQDSPAVFI